MKILILFFLLITSMKAWADVNGGITLTAVGDIMMGTTYPSNMLPQDEGKSFFTQAAPYIQASDIRFGNFEGTFYEGPPQADGKTPGPNRYLFRTPVDYVSRLVEADFNVVSLANNHSKDFGQAGLTSTKNILKMAGIQYSSKDGEVAEFNIGSVKVALIAVDFKNGARSILQPNSIYTEIEKLKKSYAVVMVSAHVGGEGAGAERVVNRDEIFLGENRGNSIAFARKAIDSGADVLIMHGPHVPRGIEVYRGRVVLYSLGNFATGAGISLSGNAAIAPLVRVKIDFNGEFIQGQVFSFVQTRESGTILDPQQRALKLIRQLSELDFASSMPQFKDNGGFSL